MHVGVAMAFSHLVSPEFIAAAARRVEAVGFRTLWVPEHVLFFPDYASAYPYSGDGKIPGDPEGVLDPFTALTYIAAHTTTIRLGTGICLVPQRQPVYTAKAVADLDYLSGGRVDFGVGIGWLAEEFANLQMDFTTRGTRCLEYIEIMRALWAPGISAYNSETYSLSECYFNPKPVQQTGRQPGPPVFFGGESDAALRRTVSHGAGWYGFNLDPATLELRLARLTEFAAAAGRDPGEIRVIVGAARDSLNEADVSRFRSLGVEQLVVPLMAADMARLDARLERLLVATGLSTDLEENAYKSKS